MDKTLNPDDVITPELRELIRKTNVMSRKVIKDSIKIKSCKQSFYPWRPRLFPGN